MRRPMTPTQRTDRPGPAAHESFRRAVAYFEEAVAIEPDFAEAYA